VTLGVSRGDGGVDEGEESDGVERRSGGREVSFAAQLPPFRFGPPFLRENQPPPIFMDLLQ
jgi:hypothetical protein